MGTIITFCRGVGFRINIKCVIGTCLHARFTSNATITIKINNAVGTGVKRGGWTNFHTWCIGAMVTSMDGKFAGGIWEFTFFNIFHMGTVYTDRNIKFTFTCHRAGMTTNAHSIIYYKSVIHFILFLPQRSQS